MVLEIALIVAGLALLLIAGDILVRGAVALAAALNVPALLVSLTIVAFGTSAPELVVTVQAILSGSEGIALGNIIGSNIANVLLVLGLPAIIYPITTHVPHLKRHAWVMLAATAALAATAYGPGMITAPIGAALFAGIVLYVLYSGLKARSGKDRDPVIDEIEEYADPKGVSLKTMAFIICGLIGLPLGAHLLVTNGASLAADLGVREQLIGLTIIAFGTSLPELATVAAASVHKKSDVAIGGIIGSNIFNILAVGGAAGLAGGAGFDAVSLQVDMPVMIAATLFLSAYIFLKRDIGRLTGLFMFGAYIGFVLALTALSGGF
ncbi:MAG: calcium/sodium antiporter [Pseudomonadota bacterium]